MSFKKIDADTSIAAQAIKGGMDQAQRGQAPEGMTEVDRQNLKHLGEKLELHKKSTRGRLPKKT